MRRTRTALWALGLVALLWRVLVLLNPDTSPLLAAEPTAGDVRMLVATNIMGLVFLACGLIVLAKTRRKRSAVFALYAICAAIHWGGPLAASSEASQAAIWMVYFILSAMLAQSAFLQFTLLFPEPWTWAPRHSTRFLIYLPVALGVVAAAMALISAPDAASHGWQDKFFILKGIQTNLFAALGLFVLVVRFVRVRPWDGPRSITGIMMFGAWISVLPWVIAMAIEAQGGSVVGGADKFTLLFSLTPLAFTLAILRHTPVIRIGTYS